MFMLEPMPMPIPTAKPISEPMPMLMFMLMFMLMIMLMGYACAHGNASAYVLLIFDVYPKFFHAREITHKVRGDARVAKSSCPCGTPKDYFKVAHSVHAQGSHSSSQLPG